MRDFVKDGYKLFPKYIYIPVFDETGEEILDFKKARNKAYHACYNMVSRCTKNKSKSFKNYGGRGILVCDRWSNSFEDFLKDMGLPRRGKSIDRIDNNNGYFPENCRWIGTKIQAINTRNNFKYKLK